jgi:hypothetical protein
MARFTLTTRSYHDYSLYLEYYNRIKTSSRQEVLKELEEKLFSHSEENAEYLCMRWGVRTLYYRKEFLGVPRTAVFEGRSFPVAEQAESILRVDYGDTWMLLPPADARLPKAGAACVGQPFQEYVEDYHKVIGDIDKAVHDIWMMKNIRLRFLSVKESQKVKKYHEKAQIYAQKLSRTFIKLKTQMGLGYSSLQNPKISKFIQRTISYLLNKSFVDWEIWVDIDDRLLAQVLYYLLNNARYYDALKIIKIRNVNKGRATGEIAEIERASMAARNISKAIFDTHDSLEAKAQAEVWRGRYPRVPDFAAGLLYYLINDENLYTESRIGALRQSVDNVLAAFPNNRPIVWLCSQFYERNGDVEKMEELHGFLLKKSNNAVIRKYIIDYRLTMSELEANEQSLQKEEAGEQSLPQEETVDEQSLQEKTEDEQPAQELVGAGQPLQVLLDKLGGIKLEIAIQIKS